MKLSTRQQLFVIGANLTPRLLSESGWRIQGVNVMPSSTNPQLPSAAPLASAMTKKAGEIESTGAEHNDSSIAVMILIYCHIRRYAECILLRKQ